MSERPYKERLKGKVQALGDYADQVMSAQSDFDVMLIIAKSIVPLIRQSKAFGRFYFQRIKDRDGYYKECNAYELNVPKEIEDTVVSLKSDIIGAALFNDADVKARIADIEAVFNNKASHGMPPYTEVVYEKIVHLLEVLLEMGREDIVKSYATVRYSSHVVINAQTGERETIKNASIQEVIFARSLSRRRELRKVFNWNNVQDVWVAWEFLVLLEWCWNTPFSFFKDKQLNYVDYQSANNSNQLLLLHNSWCLINKLKNGEKKELIASVFQRKYFVQYLELILEEIILEQETVVDRGDIIKSTAVSKDNFPYSIALKMDYSQLFLEVHWSEDGAQDTYFLHPFHEKSGPYTLLKLLLSKPVGDIVDVRKIDVSGVNVRKLLGGAGLNAILIRVFFNRIKGCMTYKISMKAKVINCADLSKDDCGALLEYLKGIECIPMKY